MRILVLGSDGQIGAPLVKYMKRRGHAVMEFDNYSFPPHDLRVPHILDNLLHEIDFVFFLAFDVGGAVYLKYYQDTYEFMSNNMKIMVNTFESLHKFNTPFIFASSQMSEMTHSTYGILKLIGERYTHELNGRVVRFWNVYGPERDTDKAHVITHFISMAMRGKIRILTTGEERRQFLYVTDCCDCLDILMNTPTEKKSFDVSSFEWLRIIDLAEIIASQCNCEVTAGTITDDVQRSKLNEPNEDILQYWHPVTNIRTGINFCIDERYNCDNSSL